MIWLVLYKGVNERVELFFKMVDVGNEDWVYYLGSYWVFCIIIVYKLLILIFDLFIYIVKIIGMF